MKVRGQLRRNEGRGDLGALELGKQAGNEEETLPMSTCFSLGILNVVLFLQYGQESFSYSSCSSASSFILFFLLRKGGWGLWFPFSPFLMDSHKAEAQRCSQGSVRTFPLFLNTHLQVKKLIRNTILLRAQFKTCTDKLLLSFSCISIFECLLCARLREPKGRVTDKKWKMTLSNHLLWSHSWWWRLPLISEHLFQLLISFPHPATKKQRASSLVKGLRSLLISGSFVSQWGPWLWKHLFFGSWPFSDEVTWRGQCCHCGHHQSARACPGVHPSPSSQRQTADVSSIFRCWDVAHERTSDLEKPILPPISVSDSLISLHCSTRFFLWLWDWQEMT